LVFLRDSTLQSHKSVGPLDYTACRLRPVVFLQASQLRGHLNGHFQDRTLPFFDSVAVGFRRQFPSLPVDADFPVPVLFAFSENGVMVNLRPPERGLHLFQPNCTSASFKVGFPRLAPYLLLGISHTAARSGANSAWRFAPPFFSNTNFPKTSSNISSPLLAFFLIQECVVDVPLPPAQSFFNLPCLFPFERRGPPGDGPYFSSVRLPFPILETKKSVSPPSPFAVLSSSLRLFPCGHHEFQITPQHQACCHDGSGSVMRP